MASFMPSLLVITVCSIQWFVIGYSFAYGEGSGVIGDFKFAFHRGVLSDPVGTIPAILFSEFQLVFEATVCAIAVGGACERGRALPLIPFIFVCSPLACPYQNEFPDNLHSFGQRSFIALWRTWYGQEPVFSPIWVFLTLLAERLSIFAAVPRLRPCQSISPIHSSGLASPLRVHHHISHFTGPVIRCHNSSL
jgi:Ammonium Transporter Family